MWTQVFFRFVTNHAFDGQTDRRTHGQHFHGSTVRCITCSCTEKNGRPKFMIPPLKRGAHNCLFSGGFMTTSRLKRNVFGTKQLLTNNARVVHFTHKIFVYGEVPTAHQPFVHY